MRTANKLVNRMEGAFEATVRLPITASNPEYVKDPITLVTFPRTASCASEEWQGQTYYFIGEATRAAFVIQNRVLAL